MTPNIIAHQPTEPGQPPRRRPLPPDLRLTTSARGWARSFANDKEIVCLSFCFLKASPTRVIADHGQNFPVFIRGQQTGVNPDLHSLSDDLAVAFLAFITEENDPAILAGNLEFCAGYRTINFEGLTVHKYSGAFLFSQELDYFLGIGGHAGGKTVFLQEIYQTLAERLMQYHNDYRRLVFYE
jgi:hypothetical protein